MRQHCIYPSYWQDQPGSVHETAFYESNFFLGIAFFFDGIVCMQATGRISQVDSLRRHSMNLIFFLALYACKLLAGSTRFT